MKVLVTGGAGYVGSTIGLALLDAGITPIVLDDLSSGRAEFLRPFAHYIGDVADPAVVARLFADHPDVSVAIHCAARTVVSESLTDPLLYYRGNVAKTVRFVDLLLRHGCRRLIFSSSAAVYGNTTSSVVTEDSPLAPISPYATSKVMVEQVLADTCAATDLQALSLRYFNPIGADPLARCGPYDPTPTHALGSLLTAWSSGRPFWIHGNDWDTADGTPLRDFVHVWDVALAHVAAATMLDGAAATMLDGAAATMLDGATAGGEGGEDGRHEIVNVGSGRGTTVRELAEAFNRNAETAVQVHYDSRRDGDTVGCYACIDKARQVLGWQPTRSVDEAIVDALGWARTGLVSTSVPR